MKVKDKLFQETLARVGKDELKGVMRLMEDKHYGIAEKHTVSKLIDYVENLERKLDIKVEPITERDLINGFLKITTNGVSHYAPRSV